MHNTGRTVFIGGSNLGRIAKAAAQNGHMIVDLTAKGWIPKSGKIDRLCETLKKLNLTEIDTVVIDSMSNTAFLGTDEDGLPIPVEKSVEVGRYHLNGDLQLAPPLCLQIHYEVGRKNYLQRGGSQNTAYSPTAQVRPGRLLRRKPCVKPSGSGFLQRNFRIRKESY